MFVEFEEWLKDRSPVRLHIEVWCTVGADMSLRQVMTSGMREMVLWRNELNPVHGGINVTYLRRSNMMG